ncbi:MAG: ATP-binding protein [Firmicutes bacterium]|nr:ATP-binding protein [Bacillota bacterium]
MKQISFVSGKGGTGKSTLVLSLSLLVQEKMLADCDVDAPNLHILLDNQVILAEDYYGARKAVIDPDICTKCGRCKEVCRFQAVNDKFEIKPMHCEGCGACILVCPAGAIRLEAVKTGKTFVAQTERGTFAHALLDTGAEGSGKLVTEVRKKLDQFKKDEKWVLIDGSPGIGCVVIASITGASAVVAVAEPTKSGLSDLERVLGVTRHFRIPGFVCINKYDLNFEITAEIENFCTHNGFPVIGRIPFDPEVMKALQEFKTPVEAGNHRFTLEIENLWKKLQEEINKFSI